MAKDEKKAQAAGPAMDQKALQAHRAEMEALLKRAEEAAARAHEARRTVEDILNAAPVPVVEEPVKRELTKTELALIDEGCRAWGIEEQYVFSSGIEAETGLAVIVTQGGKKVTYAKGDPGGRLSEIEITGVNPEWGKKKVIAGRKR